MVSISKKLLNNMQSQFNITIDMSFDSDMEMFEMEEKVYNACQLIFDNFENIKVKITKDMTIEIDGYHHAEEAQAVGAGDVAAPHQIVVAGRESPGGDGLGEGRLETLDDDAAGQRAGQRNIVGNLVVEHDLAHVQLDHAVDQRRHLVGVDRRNSRRQWGLVALDGVLPLGRAQGRVVGLERASYAVLLLGAEGQLATLQARDLRLRHPGELRQVVLRQTESEAAGTDARGDQSGHTPRVPAARD